MIWIVVRFPSVLLLVIGDGTERRRGKVEKAMNRVSDGRCVEEGFISFFFF